MALDIKEGDVLVVGSKTYPIRSVAFWAGPSGTQSYNGLRRLATVTASTKRSPAIAGGKVGSPATHIASLLCTPLDPVDPELRQRLSLDTPHEVLQVFVPDDDGAFHHLIIEELKR